MVHILGVGIATLDVINVVSDYPSEDAEVRAIDHYRCRGGNVTNTLVVLSQLGHCCTWAGVWVNNAEGQYIAEELADYGIDTRRCRIEANGFMPTSYITINQRNGSRTIVHYRNVPELAFSDFQRLDLPSFEWIHFEGRNIVETQQMLQWTRQTSPQSFISLEVEKPRPNIDALFSQVDILLFSKAFAQQCGYHDATKFLQTMRQQTPIPLVCAWGTSGAFALTTANELLHSPAYPPLQIVDTVGAGDTFNAGIIDGLCRQQDLTIVLQQACQLAGKKCGQRGFKHLVDS